MAERFEVNPTRDPAADNAQFDQFQAEAAELLREGKAFYLVGLVSREDGFDVKILSTVRGGGMSEDEGCALYGEAARIALRTHAEIHRYAEEHG